MYFKIGKDVSGPYYYNIKSYGAKGDGETDDTKAIQAAINAIPEDGGILYCPEGVYIVRGTLVIDKSYVTVLGTGINSTVFDGKNGNYNGFLLGNMLTPSTSNSVWNTTLKDFTIQNFGRDGIVIRNSLRWSIENIESSKNMGNGIFTDGAAWIGRLHNSYFYYNDKNGVHFTDMTWALDITGNHFIDNNHYGLNSPDIAQISGNTFEMNVAGDISLSRNSCFVSGNYFEGGRESGPAILVTGSSTTIEGNSIGSHYEGIRLIGATNISIKNNEGVKDTVRMYADYQSIYINKDCRFINISNESGNITVHPDAVEHVFWDTIQSKELLPEGEFHSLDDEGKPLHSNFWIDGGDEESTTLRFEVINSFAGENEYGKALLVSKDENEHSHINFNLKELEVGKIYTAGAMVSFENIANKAYDIRFYFLYDDVQGISDAFLYGSGYDRGPVLITRTFIAKSKEELVSFGSPYPGSFKIEYLSVVEGAFDSNSFPRKKYRSKEYGPTEFRPSNPKIGQEYFDSTLSSPTWWDGTNWISGGSQSPDNGDNGGSKVQKRDSIPDSGVWESGDVIYNSASGEGLNAGWICTTSGVITSNVWEDDDFIEAGHVIAHEGHVYKTNNTGFLSHEQPIPNFPKNKGGKIIVAPVDATIWQPNTQYYAYDTIIPTVDNGLFYYCYEDGVSGNVEPNWLTNNWNSVFDGDIEWEARRFIEFENIGLQGEFKKFGIVGDVNIDFDFSNGITIGNYRISVNQESGNLEITLENQDG